MIAKENCNSLGRKDWSAIIIIIKILNDRIIEDRIHIFFLFNYIITMNKMQENIKKSEVNKLG